MRIRILFVTLALALAACMQPSPASQADGQSDAHVLLGQIWLPATQRQLTWQQLVGRLQEARFVLAGEKHDNPEHHRIQARVLDAMATGERRPSVVWEMIPESKRQALTDFQNLASPVGAQQGSAVGWEESGWPEWRFYQPIAEVAIRRGLQQFPGNLDAPAVRDVARKGYEAMNNPTAETLVRNAVWTDKDQADLKKDLVDSHCGFMPDGMMQPMSRVQRGRDAVMAAALLEADLGGGALLIAGNGHVRADRGVARYLEPERRVLSIGLLEGVEGEIRPADYLENTSQFDVVIFTTRVDTPDRCAELKKRFGGKKKSG